MQTQQSGSFGSAWQYEPFRNWWLSQAKKAVVAIGGPSAVTAVNLRPIGQRFASSLSLAAASTGREH